MTITPSGPNIPQFGKAEYASRPAAGACALCNHALGSTYYKINGTIACDGCAFRARAEAPSSNATFIRSLIFGFGGAILGLIVYATFTIVTSIEIGFMSLLVGFLVGKAMKMGSNGAGGQRYQIAAVILTYAAVSLAAIPIGIAQFAHAAKSSRAHQSTSQAAPATPGAADPDASAPVVADDQASTEVAAQSVPVKRAAPSLLPVLGTLVGIALISPFLAFKYNAAEGLIGLVILFVGMKFAWRMTAGTEQGVVEGPFTRPGEMLPTPL